MRSFRLAAIGDGHIGPLIHNGRGAAGRERTFIDNRFLNWLRVILPGADLSVEAVFGTPGETTVAVARHVHAILEIDPPPEAVLVCAGMEDCLAAIKGIAPPPDETVCALEAMAEQFSASGVVPIFIVPPPCDLFSNGLFADRYVAISATLRRMHEREGRIGLVDATDVLMKRPAFGVEPDPRYVKAGSDGQLSSLGAFRLAQEVARQLQLHFPQISIRRPRTRSGSDGLNRNPLLAGSGGRIVTDAVSGRCATGYCINAHQTGGAKIQARASAVREGEVVQRLAFSGRYSTNWGLVQIFQEIDADTVNGLAGGDIIEAICDFELVAPVANIAAVSLHATAVWDNDFIGLHSSQYIGGAGVSEAHGGRLRTPRFSVPARLKKMHVSVQVHLVPGDNLTVAGELRIYAIVLRTVGRENIAVAEITGRKQSALLEARSGV
jgi:hypothetical protein